MGSDDAATGQETERTSHFSKQGKERQPSMSWVLAENEVGEERGSAAALTSTQ